MRLCLSFLVVLAVMTAAPADAQTSGFGLDLTEDEPPKEEPGVEGAGPEFGSESAPIALPPPDAPIDEAKAESDLTEREIAAEDRVKSVQRKPFLKRRRLELTPMAFLSVNDAFFPKWGPGLRAAYHLHDSFGVGLRLSMYEKISNDNIRFAKRQLQSRLPSVLPQYSAAVDLLWTPIYGKVSIFNSIKHFDLYVVGGAGAVWSQTSGLGDGPHLSTHIGLGQRFSVNRFMTIDLSAIETIYADRPNAANKSVIQHVLTLNAGVSFFVPPSFD